MQSPEIYARLTQIFHDLFDDPGLILSPTYGEGRRWSGQLEPCSSRTLGAKGIQRQIFRVRNQ
jgi:hypothetical protein